MLMNSMGYRNGRLSKVGREIVYPGQALDYEWMDGSNSGQDELAVPASGVQDNPRDYIKKSFTDNKQIRFHQCYFNPISCFR